MKKKLLSLSLASAMLFTSVVFTGCEKKFSVIPTVSAHSQEAISSESFLTMVKEAFPGSDPEKDGLKGQTVLYEEALKTILSVIGLKSIYSPSDEILLSAIENGLTEGLTLRLDDEISEKDAALLIENAIVCKDSQDELVKEKSENTWLSGLFSFRNGNVAFDGMSSYAPQESEALSDFCMFPADDFDYNSLDAEEYAHLAESGFKNPITSPLSTLAADVDTASYSNIRRYLSGGTLPPVDAVRTEEVINYFDYDLQTPSDGTPFSVTTELHPCPWNKDNLLLMLALKGDEITEKKPQNLVFLIDTSGSMHQDNRLPLIQKSMDILLNKLSPDDKITIVTYAGSSGIVLKGTKAQEKEKIMNAINSLEANGGTNGESGIRLAYDAAMENKVDGNNRIILCTDGDFNIGMTDNGSLEQLIEEKRELGIYLTILGFGMGNYKDSRMEMLADKGNGNYAYIDTLKEAKRVLSDQLTGTLYTIADDVKFQAEFNPKKVASYRLLGYENRHLEAEDFENDKKDAGEVGSGHSLVVLYEIVPGDASSGRSLTYQSAKDSDDLLTFRIRWKNPGEDKSLLKELVINEEASENKTSNFALASAAAEFSLLLRNSEYKGNASFESVIENVRFAAREKDDFGIRSEFFQLADLASLLCSNIEIADK